MIDVSRLWVTEWIVCGFFAYLIVLARVFPLSNRYRFRVLAVGLVCAGLAVMMSQLRLSPILRLARDWLPAIYLLQGYWLCGLFFRRPMVDVETRLIDADRVLFRLANVTTFLTRGPRLMLECFELTYLLAYPLVPVSFALFCWLGLRSAADSFWTAVLIAGYGCYGFLPWIQTRPPRSLERDSPVTQRGLLFRRLNLLVLGLGSVQVNTFPSGHAAVAIAAALAVMVASSGIGIVLLLLAASITAATVLGRYHYAVDSILGVLVGVLGWWVGFRLGIVV